MGKMSKTQKKSDSTQMYQLKMGPFYRLGKAAPIFRALFAGVKYPIATRKELLKKVGGDDRVLKIPGSSPSTKKLYCVKDILEALPTFDDYLPFKSEEEVIDSILELDSKLTDKAKDPKLHGRIQNKHLKVVLNKSQPYSQYMRDSSRYAKPMPIPYLPIYAEFLIPPPSSPVPPCAFRMLLTESVGYVNEAKEHLARCEEFMSVLDNHLLEFKSNRGTEAFKYIEDQKIDICYRAESAFDKAQLAWVTALRFRTYVVYMSEHDSEYIGVTYRDDPQCRVDSTELDDLVLEDAHAMRDAIEHLDDIDETNETLMQIKEIVSYPVEAMQNAEEYCDLAIEIYRLAVTVSTIQMATICGTICLENEDRPLELGLEDPSDILSDTTSITVCTINNPSFSNFTISVGDTVYQYDFSHQQDIEVNDDGTFSITGYYGPSADGPSEVFIDASGNVRTAVLHNDGHFPTYDTRSFGGVELFDVDSSLPDCVNVIVYYIE